MNKIEVYYLDALETVCELTRPVWYRGENFCGHHCFSDCSPMTTHVFETLEQGFKYFAGREIRDAPKAIR